MSRRAKNLGKYLRDLASRRWSNCFPKPAEVRLLSILGGSSLTLGFIKSRETGYPLTLVLSRGPVLRAEKFKFAAGGSLINLANDIKWGLCIEGAEYEHDVVTAQEMRDYLTGRDWHLLYIPERWLWSNPAKVRDMVLQFVA